MSSTSLVRSGYPGGWGSDEQRRHGGGFSRFVVSVGIGVASTLAWQSYGDVAREKIASAYPQLGWLAPGEAAAQTASSASASPLRSTDQQLQEVSRGLAAVRQRVEQLALQVSTSQDQLTRDIVAKMQSTERDILDKLAAAPRQDVTTAAARKPAPPGQPTQLR